MDLIDQYNFTLFCCAKLILGVHKKQASALCNLLSKLKQSQSSTAGLPIRCSASVINPLEPYPSFNKHKEPIGRLSGTSPSPIQEDLNLLCKCNPLLCRSRHSYIAYTNLKKD